VSSKWLQQGEMGLGVALVGQPDLIHLSTFSGTETQLEFRFKRNSQEITDNRRTSSVNTFTLPDISK
jgi:hypothetical protein